MSIAAPRARLEPDWAVASAQIVQELRDEDYGSRGYMARDLKGHLWYFGTYRLGAYWDSAPE